MKKTENHRWLWFVCCIAFSALLLVCGWLVPMHLRAVDASLLQRAGQDRPSLIVRGLTLERANNPEAARLILQAAQSGQIPGADTLASAVAPNPENQPLFPGGPSAASTNPVTSLLIKSENREPLLAYLKTTGSSAVTELLLLRELTNTAVFPASSSTSGQAIDTALSLCGLLLKDNHLAPGLRDVVLERATSVATRAEPQPLEDILMDFLSLGQRFDWGQLVAFLKPINDATTLSRLTTQVRNAGPQLPQLFAAVVLSEKPDQVAAYLNDFTQTGLNDLSASLRDGEGGVDELLQRDQRRHAATSPSPWLSVRPVAGFVSAMTDCALRAPWFALMLKWFFFMLSGFLLAAAGHFALPPAVDIEKPLRVRGFHLIRECLFALGFLLVVLLLSEPFLASESQKAPFAIRLRLPVAGAAATSSNPLIKTKLMDTRSLITLAIFFVLQALIYCACLAKLAEIRRQKVPPRVQLKLLENEEHLFDGGLYLGFAGTIVCLILVSLGIIQQSLMAAYSSTSFGIIFVSVFKIFNLRPVRRRLLMQSEEQPPQPATTTRPVTVQPALASTQ